MPPAHAHDTTPALALALAVAWVLLAACAATTSQLTLAPLYGSLPPAVNHHTAMVVAFGVGAGLQAWATSRPSSRPSSPPSARISAWLAVWSCWLPLLQSLLRPCSRRLGPRWGPALNAALACHAVVVPCAYAAAAALDRTCAALDARCGAWPGRVARVGVALVFIRAEQRTSTHIPRLFSAHSWLSPVRLQLAAAAPFALLSWLASDAPPSLRRVSLFLLAVPALLHAVYLNPHVGVFASPNHALAAHNWTLIDRAWSNTGYISVLESSNHHYRLLRCDHSLLGGEWLVTPQRARQEGWRVNEPVYSAFEMLEAVRLMQHPDAEAEGDVPDPSAQKALVIGLGVGTAPKAMLAHGIPTTIVELDPTVHRFATDHFHLPTNHTAILQDAVAWVSSQASQIPETDHRYDYIIHDVFTGGAEPLSLFTTDFLRDLRRLMKPRTGTLAINYAGDLSLPLTNIVLNTIRHAFTHHDTAPAPSSSSSPAAPPCRLFHDAPPPPPPATPQQPPAFLNLVVFCRNDVDADARRPPIRFRAPTEPDFLSSRTRRHHLPPRPDRELPLPALPDDRLLRPADLAAWARVQADSAARHWRIMRAVLPDPVWELW